MSDKLGAVSPPAAGGYSTPKRRMVQARLSDQFLSSWLDGRSAPDTVTVPIPTAFGPAEPLVPMKRSFPDDRKCVPYRDVKRRYPIPDIEECTVVHCGLACSINAPSSSLSHKLGDLQEYRATACTTTSIYTACVACPDVSGDT